MSVIKELVGLSLDLGKEERDLAMLGEGNTSALAGPGQFWVKASGTRMGRAVARNFLKVDIRKALRLLETKGLSDLQVMHKLRDCVAGKRKGQPSSETFMHALCLTEGKARWAGHTHPVALGGILCSRLHAKPFLKSVFPDEIVYCGKAPAVLPYIAPGVKLALALRKEIRRYRAKHGYPPRLILLVNHGILALGQTAEEVLNISMMAEKWAKVLLGTYALGGPGYMHEREAAHIDAWPAEHYRRRLAVYDKGGKR
jgi:rhamnose utilization protein RhaD (predicted bifunctional aldolase and dehydrogenase)